MKNNFQSFDGYCGQCSLFIFLLYFFLVRIDVFSTKKMLLDQKKKNKLKGKFERGSELLLHCIYMIKRLKKKMYE